MKELTCIGCPRGCTLKIERDGDGWSVTGNTCPRGREFAVSEMTAPRRTICSTVRTAFPDAPVLPVRVSADIPKDRIFDVMDAIRTVTVTERIARGGVKEVILAISTSVEGETTLFYLMNRLRQFPELKVTSIARGIGFGDELEYVDELTITHALLNRREVE